MNNYNILKTIATTSKSRVYLAEFKETSQQFAIKEIFLKKHIITKSENAVKTINNFKSNGNEEYNSEKKDEFSKNTENYKYKSKFSENVSSGDESADTPQFRELYQSEVNHIFNERDVLTKITENKVKNVCHLVDKFREPGAVVLVLTYIKGKMLCAEYLLEECFMNFHFASEIVKKIAIILQDLHDLNIIYRDLKSANVLIDGDTPFLVDFGLAKILDSPIARTKSICGTEFAMAPEMSNLSDPIENVSYSYSIDWWALGVLFYEILHGGKPPFGYHSPEGKFHLKSSAPSSINFSKIEREPDGQVIIDILKLLLTSEDNRISNLKELKRTEWWSFSFESYCAETNDPFVGF